tara:strand:+ start:1277 stop:1618 length:342 start_codon:yes stop_codon:yes gene_type:complete
MSNIIAKTVKAMNIKKVVDDHEWQILRKKLIGNWKNNHTYNVSLLKKYAKKYWNDPLAIRRVINVLTGSVHRVGWTKGQDETDALRSLIRKHWRDMLEEPYDPEDPKYKKGTI